MEKSMKHCPCVDCTSHCKPVFAILLIVLGVSLLKDVIQHKNGQK